MAHKFDVSDPDKLDRPERKALLPAAKILQKAGLNQGMHFADIGCGGGFFSLPAAGIVGSSGKIWAVDISEEMLAHLQSKDPPAQVSALLSSENQFPIPDQAVDMVLVAFVLHEAEAKTQFLSEIKRIMKSTARLIIIDFKKIHEEKGPPREDRISREEVVSLLRDAGFQIEKTISLNDSHYQIIAQS